jgi:hypothetical protein
MSRRICFGIRPLICLWISIAFALAQTGEPITGTTEFAKSLKSLGYNSVSPDQMVTMRIHGVSMEFIREVESLGYDRPSIDKLVTMKIHGITPDDIRKVQARGFNNLSIDQLVRLKIHGVLD